MSEIICDKMELHYYSEGEWKSIRATDCKVKISKPRNVKHHRMVIGILSYVIKHKTSYPEVNSIERILKAYKKAYGRFREYTDVDGQLQTEYDSINFASMNEVKFKPVSDEIKQFCYIILNGDGCSQEIIEGLLQIEFN